MHLLRCHKAQPVKVGLFVHLLGQLRQLQIAAADGDLGRVQVLKLG